MRHLIVVLAALLIPTATMAEGPCKNDVQKFCKDATTPEGSPPRACLDQHKAELSEACKAKLEAMGKEVAEGACKEDGQKFCKGSADFFACLDQHKAELSEACKAKLEMEDVFTFSVTNVVIALIGLISALVGFVMVCRIWIEERAKGG